MGYPGGFVPKGKTDRLMHIQSAFIDYELVMDGTGMDGVRDDSLLGVHMKTNGAKHSKLKELFFPQRTLPHNHEEAVPARVARWTSVFWVACVFSIETRKHWKNVNNAVRHCTKMPAPFFYSQLEKDALNAEKVEKLKAARQKNLE